MLTPASRAFVLSPVVTDAMFTTVWWRQPHAERSPTSGGSGNISVGKFSVWDARERRRPENHTNHCQHQVMFALIIYRKIKNAWIKKKIKPRVLLEHTTGHCCFYVALLWKSMRSLPELFFICMFSDLHILDHQTNSNISQRRKWLSFSLLACVIFHKPHFWKAESATPSQDFFQTGWIKKSLKRIFFTVWQSEEG